MVERDIIDRWLGRVITNRGMATPDFIEACLDRNQHPETEARKWPLKNPAMEDKGMNKYIKCTFDIDHVKIHDSQERAHDGSVEYFPIDDTLKVFVGASDIGQWVTIKVRPVINEYSKIPYGWLKIRKVVFNAPATIVFWADGTKTVVKCSENESYDPEKGLMAAVTKKAFGNLGNYYNNIKNWLPKEEETQEPVPETEEHPITSEDK